MVSSFRVQLVLFDFVLFTEPSVELKEDIFYSQNVIRFLYFITYRFDMIYNQGLDIDMVYESLDEYSKTFHHDLHGCNFGKRYLKERYSTGA